MMSGNEENPGPSVQGRNAPLENRMCKRGCDSLTSQYQSTSTGNSSQCGIYQTFPVLVNRTRQGSLISVGNEPDQERDSLQQEYLNQNQEDNAQEKNPSRPVSPEPPKQNDSSGREGQSSPSNKSRSSRISHSSKSAKRTPSPPRSDRRYSDDVISERGNEIAEQFFEKSIRRAFIRKVYLLVMSMLLVTTSFTSLMMFYKPAHVFVMHNYWLLIVSWVMYPMLILVLICCQKARRTVPWNYIILFLMTTALSLLVGVTASKYSQFEVLAAVGITTVLCLGLTLFAFQTKWDFTVISGALVIGTLIMVILSLVLIFWRNRIAMIGYSCLGAFLGCMFFIFDTQMMMGGYHKYAISPEEYVFAAVSLFTDIINIFLMILNIITLSRS